MHDILFAARIVALLKEKNIKSDDAKHVTVNVSLAAFSHVSKDSLSSAFTVLAQREGFSGVTLKVKTNEIVIKCRKCLRQSKILKPVATCPECDEPDFEVDNFQEFVIDSIEI